MPGVHQAVNRVLALAALLFLCSCALIGGYSAKSHEHITAIKASHLKFIDMFTEGDNRAWELRRFTEESDKIDLKFREALEFSKSLDDNLRTSNISLLKEIFEEDMKNIKNKNRLITNSEARMLIEPSSEAYDRVIKGECARASSSCR